MTLLPMCIRCTADKTGAKVVEDWICPTFNPTSPRPHDDDPAAGDARINAQGSAAAGTSTVNRADLDADTPADGVDRSPVVGAYVGVTLIVLMVLLAVTAVVSYYIAVRS